MVVSLSSHTCLSRSTTSSLFFDLATASLFVFLDEVVQIRAEERGIETPIFPPTAPFWFFHFRMYSQTCVLVYNIIRLALTASENQLMWLLSTIRCILIILMLIFHYWVCTYHWKDMLAGKYTKRLLIGTRVTMPSYWIIGIISASVDPFFASDRIAMICFFLFPVPIRYLGILASFVYEKIFSNKVKGVVVKLKEMGNHVVHTCLLSVFMFSLAIAVPYSLWFADRILFGIITLGQFVLFFYADKFRVTISTIKEKRASSKQSRLNASSIVPALDEPDEEDQQAPEITPTVTDNITPFSPNNGLVTPFTPSIGGAYVNHEDLPSMRDLNIAPHHSSTPTQGPIADNPSEHSSQDGATNLLSMSHIPLSGITNSLTLSERGQNPTEMLLQKTASQLTDDIKLRKGFSTVKQLIIWIQIMLTFLFIIAFELALSMYVYHRDGVPTNWCQPFSFETLLGGFQVMFDYVL